MYVPFYNCLNQFEGCYSYSTNNGSSSSSSSNNNCNIDNILGIVGKECSSCGLSSFQVQGYHSGPPKRGKGYHLL